MQQKKAIRIISNSGYNAHTAPLFNSLDILPLAKVITQAKLTFMHSVYYEHAPTSFANPGKHKHKTTQTSTYVMPQTSIPGILLFKRLPLYSLPNTLNSHDTVRYCANRTTFKYALHNLLHSAADQAADDYIKMSSIHVSVRRFMYGTSIISQIFLHINR
jgi:hypothetical protein